jgi:hypothetical protein
VTKRYVGPDHPGALPAYIENPNEKDSFVALDRAPDEMLTAAISKLRVNAQGMLDEAERLEAYRRRRASGESIA